MNCKKMVLPIGTALAALISNDSEAAKVPTDPGNDLPGLQAVAEAGQAPTAPIVQELKYQIAKQDHSLTLHKSPSGVLYAQHRSHSSHASHMSHMSHRSGY